MTYEEVLNKRAGGYHIGTPWWTSLQRAQITPAYKWGWRKSPLNTITPRQHAQYRASLGNNQSTVGISSLDMVDDQQLEQAAAPVPQGAQGQQNKTVQN